MGEAAYPLERGVAERGSRERREMRREEEDGAEHGDSGGFGGFIYIKRARLRWSLSLSCLADAVGVCGDLVRSLDLNLSLLVGFSSAA